MLDTFKRAARNAIENIISAVTGTIILGWGIGLFAYCLFILAFSDWNFESKSKIAAIALASLAVYIYSLTRFVLSILFDKGLRAVAQRYIDNIRNYKYFCRLYKLKSYQVPKIFNCYLSFITHQSLGSAHIAENENFGYDHFLSKRIINLYLSALDNTYRLQDEIRVCENKLKEALKDIEFQVDPDAIRKAIEEEYFGLEIEETSKKLINFFLNNLKKPITIEGVDFIERIIKFHSDITSKSFKPSGNERVDNYHVMLWANFKINRACRKYICDLLKEAGKTSDYVLGIDKLLQEWDQLSMLINCTREAFTFAPNSGIERIYWMLIYKIIY